MCALTQKICACKFLGNIILIKKENSVYKYWYVDMYEHMYEKYIDSHMRFKYMYILGICFLSKSKNVKIL